MRTSAKLIALSLPLFLTACSEQPPEEESNVLPVVVTQVITPQTSNLTKQFIGKTEAVDWVNILPKVSGYIVNQAFKDGAKVNQGQLLFEIDSTPYRVDVEQAQAVLAQKVALYQLQKKKLKKAEALSEQQALSTLELDQIQAESMVMSAEVQAAEAALNRAKIDLYDTKIFAPFDGIISDARVGTGALVGPDSEPLTNLVAYKSMYVMIQLDEKEYLNDLQKKVQAGDQIIFPSMALELANGTQFQYPGEVDFIDNQVDSNNGNVRFRVRFPNPDGLLLPGQFVTVTSTERRANQVLIVPQNLVQEDQAGRFVLTVNAQQIVEVKYLQLGQRLNENWIVEGGLQAGERLIVKGVKGLRPGSQVNTHPLTNNLNQG